MAKRNTWLDRLSEEAKELDSKLDKLVAFRESEATQKIDNLDVSLLAIQESAMRTYLGILNMRLLKQDGIFDKEEEIKW